MQNLGGETHSENVNFEKERIFRLLLYNDKKITSLPFPLTLVGRRTITQAQFTPLNLRRLTYTRQAMYRFQM
jgi:hypothetical protein